MHAMSIVRAWVFALAGVTGIAPGVLPAPAPVALVEEVSGHPAGAQLMDYLEPGSVIRLGPRDRLVLGYLRSCVRETITGGVVTIGSDQSIQAGKLERAKIPCDGARMLRAAEPAGPAAGMVFRGASPRAADPQFTLFGSSLMLELGRPGTVVIERMDQSGERHVIDIGKEQMVHGIFYDVAHTGKALAPGGVYRATFAGQDRVFKIDADAKPGRTAIAGRLLRFAPSN
jgi:hypothetical protein